MANMKGGGRCNRRCDVRYNKFGKVIGGHHHHDGNAVQHAERRLNRALRKHGRALCRAYAAGDEEPRIPMRSIPSLHRNVNWKCT